MVCDNRKSSLDAVTIAPQVLTAEGLLVFADNTILTGQSIFHVHIHLIPRYKGDTPNPRGGIRGVIPSKQNY